jgi:hypothetical protein
MFGIPATTPTAARPASATRLVVQRHGPGRGGRVDDRDRGARPRHGRQRVRDGFALVEQLQVARHAGDAVRVDAAQVRPDERVGDRRGLRLAGAPRLEHASDESPQVVRAHQHFRATGWDWGGRGM